MFLFDLAIITLRTPARISKIIKAIQIRFSAGNDHASGHVSMNLKLSKLVAMENGPHEESTEQTKNTGHPDEIRQSLPGRRLVIEFPSGLNSELAEGHR